MVNYKSFRDAGVIAKDGLNEVAAPYFLDTDCGGADQPNQITFNAGDPSGEGCGVTSNSLLSTNKWYHIVGTYDGTVMKLYIDGALDNSRSYVGGIPTSDDDLIIGGYYSTDFLSNSKIDDVRIYNRALSAAEVKQLYNAGR
jgi:hypothetical protein